MNEQRKPQPQEIASLYVEHGEPLRRFLVGVLRDPQLASDVLQTAFTRLIERGEETHPDKRKAWLYQVAYREALAVRRRQGTAKRANQKIAEEQLAEERPTPASVKRDGVESELVRMETVDGIRSKLAELPEDYRQIVRHRIYDEQTFAQIAASLDLPLGTVITRMRRALELLRGKLNQEQDR